MENDEVLKGKPVVLQTISFAEEDAVKELHANYRIRSDDLDPAEITRSLGIQPSRSWVKYEKYLGKRFDPETEQVVPTWAKRPPWGMWSVNTEGIVLSKKVEQHLLYLLELLEPKADRIKYYLEHCEAISCYVWWEPFDGHGSYVISSDILKRMAALCHHMEFGVIYRVPGDDEV
ncbi:MAG: DUF4279 domain-containing protein [Anaerolineae bacterium]|nr:DUF4279 domain-containing protein [Anaerolineae bacterium]